MDIIREGIRTVCLAKRVILGTLYVLICIFCLIAIGVLGATVKNPDPSRQIFQPYVDRLNNELEAVQFPYRIDLDDVEILSMIMMPLKLLIFVFILIFILSFCAFITLFTSFHIFRIIEIIVSSVFLLAFFIGFCMLMNIRTIMLSKKTAMKEQIEENYEGLITNDQHSMVWNAAMGGLECCGVDGYKDFQGAKKWSGKKNITLGKAIVPIDVDMPLACCKYKIVLSLKPMVDAFNKPSGTFDENHPAIRILQCAQKNNSADNNKDTGCYDAGFDVVETFTKSFLFIAHCILFMLLLAASIVYGVITLIGVSAVESSTSA